MTILHGRRIYTDWSWAFIASLRAEPSPIRIGGDKKRNNEGV